MQEIIVALFDPENGGGTNLRNGRCCSLIDTAVQSRRPEMFSNTTARPSDLCDKFFVRFIDPFWTFRDERFGCRVP